MGSIDKASSVVLLLKKPTNTGESEGVSQQWVQSVTSNQNLAEVFWMDPSRNLLEPPHFSPSHCLPLSVPLARHSSSPLTGLFTPNRLPWREKLKHYGLQSRASLLNARGCPFCLLRWLDKRWTMQERRFGDDKYLRKSRKQHKPNTSSGLCRGQAHRVCPRLLLPGDELIDILNDARCQT